jgi:hypothetical protein
MSIRNSRVARMLVNRALAAALTLAVNGIATPSPAATALHEDASAHSDIFPGRGATGSYEEVDVDARPDDTLNQCPEEDGQGGFSADDSVQI